MIKCLLWCKIKATQEWGVLASGWVRHSEHTRLLKAWRQMDYKVRFSTTGNEVHCLEELRELRHVEDTPEAAPHCPEAAKQQWAPRAQSVWLSLRPISFGLSFSLLTFSSPTTHEIRNFSNFQLKTYYISIISQYIFLLQWDRLMDFSTLLSAGFSTHPLILVNIAIW